MARNNEPGQGRRKGNTSGSGQVSRYARPNDGNVARWGDVDSGRLTDMLDALQSAGDAVIFGATRDGGVLVLTVCSGEERAKFYAKSAAEMDGHIQDVCGAALASSGRDLT